MVATPQISVAVTSAVFGAGTSSTQSTVRSAGHPVITGAMLSDTVITWLAVAVFPQLSVAVQVRVTNTSDGQSPVLVASVKPTSTLSSQLSVAVTTAASGNSSTQESTRSAGTPSRTGGVSSIMVMV